MINKAPLETSTISRRTTLQLALATLAAGQFIGLPRSGAAKDESANTWNWGGNAGHTGELPGPGLNLEGALGELWRIPRDEFGDGDDWAYDWRATAGSLNGVVYTWTSNSLWARSLLDGKFLWGLTPTKLSGPATPQASPEANSEELELSSRIAIDGNLVLVSLRNGHLWALDAMTGDLR